MKWFDGCKMRKILFVLVLALGLASTSYAAQDTWTRKADMPTARYHLSASVVNGKIYVIGGWDEWRDPTPFATVEVYDPATDTWESKADMPTARGALATAVVDGKIYAIGGGRGNNPLSTVEVYDPATDTWEQKANMQIARWWNSAAVVDGKIYAIGGYPSSTMEVYDPATDTWTRKANMPTIRWAFGTGVVNGRIYAIGGDADSNSSSVIEYDPAADSWTYKANMPTARAGLSAAVVDGKIYAIGGDPYRNAPALATVEVYDPAMDTWEKKDEMPTARTALATAVVDVKIYAIGGAPTGGGESSTGRSLTTVYEYDPGLPPPDFNGDFKIDIEDLIILIEHWGQDEPSVDIAPPPSGDGIVDVQDLEVFMSYWGQELFDPRLIAHWKLDETEGIIAQDSVGEHDGTLHGEPIWQPIGGMVNGAFQLDGVDDYVSTDFVLNPADGPFSVFAWLKGGGPGQTVISQTGGANWLCLDPSEGKLMTSLMPLPGGRFPPEPLLSEFVITEGLWRRVGLVWDGSYRTLYVDDTEVAKDIFSQGQLISADGGLYFGAGKNLDAGSFFSGLIDDVRIYNRAVSP